MNEDFAKLSEISPYCRAYLEAHPHELEVVSALSDRPMDSQVIAEAWEKTAGLTSIQARLRVWRNRIMIALAQRARRGQATNAEVGQTMTRLAEFAVQQAFHSTSRAMLQDYGTPLDLSGRPQDLLVIGMGKLGGRELNVSSDIDLVLIYREQGESSGDSTGAGKLAVSEYFARQIQLTLPLLQDLTADGFVFRVDLRLRPHGDSGPIACSLGFLEDYLVSEGRAWERFAWLKSRAIAWTTFGPEQSVQDDLRQLRQIVEPFVYRRYLDFAAIHSLRELHQLIQQEQSMARRSSNQIDVKLGRGGIREIEFGVQLMQIVRAGREPGLRERNTLSAIEKLKQRQVITGETASALTKALNLLRDTEHAIQWRNDQQTHQLRTDDEAVVGAIAQHLSQQHFKGVSDPLELRRTFLQKLDECRQEVACFFDQITLGGADTAAPSSDSTPDLPPLAVTESGRFKRSSETVQAQVTKLIAQARQICTELGPQISSDLVLKRFSDFLELIIGRPGYLTLLNQYPGALARLLKLFQRSAWAANYVQRYPIVLDELITQPNQTRICWLTAKEQLNEQLETAIADQDTERLIDLLREFQHTYTVRLLMQEIEAALSVEALADDLSALADLIIETSLRLVAKECGVTIDGPDHFAVIAYGKLGGKELGYSSDLDLVFLYDSVSDDAQEKYTRLARKLIQWLTMRTGAGGLYEVDLRLRPDGDAGQLVISTKAFEIYQLEKAWLWEHQALTRARYCAGSPVTGSRFEAIRRAVLTLERPAQEVARKVAEMRTKVHDGHPNRTELFDLKHDSGGMIDLEFAVQTLVLTHAVRYPALVGNVGNLALLHLAAQLGLIPEQLANDCAQAYRRMRRTQYNLRLNQEQEARVIPEEWNNERAAIKSLWELLFGR